MEPLALGCAIAVLLAMILFRFNLVERPVWILPWFLVVFTSFVTLKKFAIASDKEIFLYLTIASALGFLIKEIVKLLIIISESFWEGILKIVEKPKNSLLIVICILGCVFYIYNKELFFQFLQVGLIAVVIAYVFWAIFRARHHKKR